MSISSNVAARGTSIVVRGTTSRSPICSAVLRPAVGLDEADDDVGAALVPAPALVEHREGLADAGGGAEVDAQLAPRPSSTCLRPSWSSARFSSSTFTACSPRKPQLAVLRCARRSSCRAPVAAGSDRASATRAAWSRALATEMCGSSPDADAVTASTGTATSAARPLSARYGVGSRRVPSSFFSYTVLRR